MQHQKKKRVLLICEGHLPSDGRAIRFASAFKQAGYHVIGAGFEPGARSPPVSEHAFDQLISIANPLDTMLTRYAVRSSFVLGTMLRPLARYSWWLIPHQWPFLRAIEREVKLSGGVPNIIVAKYWTATPVALYLAKKYNAKIIYDANEVGFAERLQNWKWRKFVKPVIEMIEREMLATADLTTTIGKAVSKAYAEYYNLNTLPLPIRNIPDNDPVPPTNPGEELQLLYVGHADPARKLDIVVGSVKYWKPDRHLVLQLTGRKDHIEALKTLSRELSLDDRVEFRRAVPQQELISSMAASDVGLCLLPIYSLQTDLAEPNKIYQYFCAGLAVLASEMTTVSGILEHYDCGISGSIADEEKIAGLVNSIGHEQVLAMHEGVRRAQSELSWEKEGEKLVEAVDRIFS